MPEFGNNFFKDVQDLYKKNEKTLSYSWCDIPYSWIGSFNSLKMSIHPTSLYVWFNLSQGITRFVLELEKLNLNAKNQIFLKFI